jgi:NAD(P)H-dependent FMN reductase
LGDEANAEPPEESRGRSLGVVARLLIVHHTSSPSLDSLFRAAHVGANDPAIDGVEVVARPALGATAVDVLEADGYLLGTPANLGYMSGALKHFFDQIYYPCLDATVGRPFGVYVHGNDDTTGAVRAIEVVTTGLRWRAAQAPVEVVGQPDADDLAACRELGAALAAGLAP